MQVTSRCSEASGPGWPISPPRRFSPRSHAGAAVLAASLLAGCAAATQPLSRDALARLSADSFEPVTGQTPPFLADAPIRAALAFIGTAASREEGRRIVAANGIVDPVRDVAAQLADALHSPPGSSTADPAHQRSRLTLEVATTAWGFTYLRDDLDRFRVTYSAAARVIDTADGAVLGRARCDDEAAAEQGAARLDEMLADRASLLKNRLQQAGRRCARILRDQLLVR